MGVLNVTPDSFSDGARFVAAPETIDIAAAVADAKQMVAAGASIIDVGGESTRPGATLVGAVEEQRRAIPVVEALAASSAVAENNVKMSIDTIRATTAEAAVVAGARIINDVSGGTYDPEMYETVAKLSKIYDLQYIIGHWRGVPDVANARSDYTDVALEVCQKLVQQAEAAVAAGVPRNSLIIDPGLGFDKNTEQSWQILQRIADLKNTGYPLCIGVSRKRMLADIAAKSENGKADFASRDLATAVVTALAAGQGVDIVRVHDVAGSMQALEVARLYGGRAHGSCGSGGRGHAGCGDVGRGDAGCGDVDRGHAGCGCDARERDPQSNAADTIKLTGLEVFAHHGVFDFERQNGQKFIIDIEVKTDLRAAIASDELAKTVHYGELAERAHAAVSQDPVDLIETVAERVAKIALEFEAAQSVTVTVHKPDAPITVAPFADVSIKITRDRVQQ